MPIVSSSDIVADDEKDLLAQMRESASSLAFHPRGTVRCRGKLHMKPISFTLSRLLSRTAIILFAVLVSLGLPASRAAAQSDGDRCWPVQYADSAFVACTMDLRKYEVRLFWRGPDGEVLGSFDRLKDTPEDSRLAVAMNAGIYHDDCSPVGLFVENGKELKAANTRNGPGNFHLKPNGIFYVKGRQAGVLETGTCLKRKIRPDFATQSGPMLVINGQIHPQFSEQSTLRKIRNGVGVKGRDTVVFAISEDSVTLSTFARLFRDELGCANALFLNGSVSSLYAPSLQRVDTLMPVGPIVGALADTHNNRL